MQAASNIFRWNPSGRWLLTKMPAVPVPCQHGLKPTINSFPKWHTVLLTSLFIRQSLEELYRMEVLLQFSPWCVLRQWCSIGSPWRDSAGSIEGYNTIPSSNTICGRRSAVCPALQAVQMNAGIWIQLSQAPLSPHLVPGIGHKCSRNKILKRHRIIESMSSFYSSLSVPWAMKLRMWGNYL